MSIICTNCGVRKDESEFHWKNRKRGKRQIHCKICFLQLQKQRNGKNPERRIATVRRFKEKLNKQSPKGYRRYYRNQQLKKSFGITLDQYNAMLTAQGGVCSICNQPETDTRRGEVKSLAVDHDRKTTAVRGLLCRACNVGLGHFEHSPKRLRKAIAYLEYHGTAKHKSIQEIFSKGVSG